MRTVKDPEDCTAVREPGDANEEQLWWSIWATHYANDATVTETAQTFSLSRTKVWRAVTWCARELSHGRATEATREGLAYQKRIRIREVRKAREVTMKEAAHIPAQGYLREERELENEIASLEGVAVTKANIELTGAGGGAIRTELDIPPNGELATYLRSAARLAESVAHCADGNAEAGEDGPPGMGA